MFSKEFLTFSIWVCFQICFQHCANPKRKFHSWAVADLAQFYFTMALKIGHWITIHNQWFTSINCIWDKKVSTLITTKHFIFPIKTFWFLFRFLHSDTGAGLSESNSKRTCFPRSVSWEVTYQRGFPSPELSASWYSQIFGLCCSVILHNSSPGIKAWLKCDQTIGQIVEKQIERNCNLDIWQGIFLFLY